jgi:DNA-binding CsgD family transcriptional regulator
VFSTLRTPSHPLDDLALCDIEMLRPLAQGCTLSKIADTLRIAYKTAANSCSRIKAKLGAAGIAGLIRIAIRCGLVDRDPSRSAALPEGVGVDRAAGRT